MFDLLRRFIIISKQSLRLTYIYLPTKLPNTNEIGRSDQNGNADHETRTRTSLLVLWSVLIVKWVQGEYF